MPKYAGKWNFNFNYKLSNMKFVSVSNEKATFKFHVPVQTPAFPFSSQGDVSLISVLDWNAADTAQLKSAAGKMSHIKKLVVLAISDVKSSMHELRLCYVRSGASAAAEKLLQAALRYYIDWYLTSRLSEMKNFGRVQKFASIYPAPRCTRLC